MFRYVVAMAIFFLAVPAVYADEQPTLEEPTLEQIVQRLDWDMTRTARRGVSARVRAVNLLKCIGRVDARARHRVLQTVGRLMGHYHHVVVYAASRISDYLKADQELKDYLQPFYLRRGVPHWDRDIRELAAELIQRNDEGIEIIQEYYPDRNDVRYLNYLARLYKAATQKDLIIRLRIFNLKEPGKWDNIYLNQIAGILIKDFHIGPGIGVNIDCEKIPHLLRR